MATEKRLIDKDAYLEALDAEYVRKMKVVRNGNDHLDTLAEGIMSASVVLATMPTVDAVEVVEYAEVVRCKDCKHFVQGEPYDPCECMKWMVKYGVAYTTPDGYCHKGEHKTENP